MVELIACDLGLSYFRKTEGLLDAICILIRLIAILVYTSISWGKKKLHCTAATKLILVGTIIKFINILILS